MLMHYEDEENANSLLPTGAAKVSYGKFMKNLALFYSWDWTFQFMILE